MRVLHVIGAMDRGGAETMIMNLYRAMDKDQIQFDFLVHEQDACDYDEEIEDLGGRIYRLPRFTGLNIIEYRRLCRQFFSSNKDHPIVHGHIGSCAPQYLSVAKKAGRLTIAHSHAQNFPLSIPQLGFRFVSFPTRFVAHRFLACSNEAGRDRFGSRVVESDKFSIVKNGIDLSLYNCNKETQLQLKREWGNEEAFLIGHVGRFASEKNHRFLLEVFSLVHDRMPQAKLMLIGRGPLEDELRNWIDAHGLHDAVEFLGIRGDVPEVLKTLDVFVFPSFSEGLAMACVEAQTAGTPCVISTGVPESAVIDDVTVRLPLSKGAAAWADAVANVSGQKVDHLSRVDEARTCGYDINETARWLEQYYRALVGV